MIKYSILIISILISACTFENHYNTTQVGPDRIAVSSTGHDTSARNQTVLLQRAYQECQSRGFTDYQVSSEAQTADGVVLFVRCVDKEDAKEESNTSNSLKDYWEAFKRAVEK